MLKVEAILVIVYLMAVNTGFAALGSVNLRLTPRESDDLRAIRG